MKRTWKGYLFAGPLLLGFLLFYVLPFGQVVWDSLSQGTGKSQLFVGLENYSRMFQNDMFRMAFGNTMGFLGIGLPVILLVSYGLALFLKRQARRFQLLRTVFLLPYVMPVAGTVLLVDLLFSREGLVNRLFLTLGLPLADWLQSPAAFWVMLILYLWKSTGYAVVLLLAGLMAIPLTTTPWPRWRAPAGGRPSATSPCRKCGTPCSSPLCSPLSTPSSASGRFSWWAGNTPTRRCTCFSTLSTIPLRT